MKESEDLSAKKRSSLSRKSEIEDVERIRELKEEKRTLTAKLKEREEMLRKTDELEQLTSKWREVAQEVAECLLASSIHEPRPTMGQMLDYLHIDHELIQYSQQKESFY